MSPIDWAVLPLKKYATFSGRAPRAEYWWFYLGYMILYVLLQVLVRISAVFGLLGLAYLGLIIPMLAVGVRRLHDTNRSGWWLLAPIVPYAAGFAMIIPQVVGGAGTAAAMTTAGPAMILLAIGFILAIVIFIFTVLPGTKGPNRYGADPYDEDNLHEVFA
jgi:uncharacterized membrane protein YhaH (DUF805 family)